MEFKTNFIRVTGAIVLALLIAVSAGFGQNPAKKSYDQYLIERLKDKNIGVRSSAAQLLGERRTSNAVKPLLQMLKNDKCYACRIVAAQALYKIGDPKALPALKKIAKKDKNRTARHVVRALVREMEMKKFAQK